MQWESRSRYGDGSHYTLGSGLGGNAMPLKKICKTCKQKFKPYSRVHRICYDCILDSKTRRFNKDERKSEV